MSAKLKISAYVVLVLATLWFAWKFHLDYSQTAQPVGGAGATNAVLPTPATTNPPAPAGAKPRVTPQPTNTPAATNSPAAASSAAETAGPAPDTRRGKMLIHLAAFVLTAAGLGLLIAYDLTQLIGSRAVDLLFSDKGELMKDPEYERAEAVWADGKALEAVEMMELSPGKWAM